MCRVDDRRNFVASLADAPRVVKSVLWTFVKCHHGHFTTIVSDLWITHKDVLSKCYIFNFDRFKRDIETNKIDLGVKFKIGGGWKTVVRYVPAYII